MNSFKKFCDAVFPIRFYILFCFIWFFGMQLSFLTLNKISYKWCVSDIYITVSCFLTLLLIRSIDEIKDFHYDKINNPNRPLVKGYITRKELLIYSFICTSGIITSGFFLFSSIYPVTICIYIYTIFIFDKTIEKLKNPFLILMVVFPCSAQIYLFFNDYFIMKYTSLGNTSEKYTTICSPFILSFLSFEILRKTGVDKSTKGTYQDAIGFWYSFLLGQFLALLSSILLYYYLKSMIGFLFENILILFGFFAGDSCFSYFNKISIKFISLTFLFSTYIICIINYLTI
ncbi:hypothetical protein [Klebsiella pneumoniae]